MVDDYEVSSRDTCSMQNRLQKGWTCLRAIFGEKCNGNGNENMCEWENATGDIYAWLRCLIPGLILHITMVTQVTRVSMKTSKILE